MNNRPLRFSLGVCLVTFGMCLTSSADALYTFEAPQFTVGQSTPLLNQAPNSGSPMFNTSFTDAGDPGGAGIGSVAVFQPNSLMVGQFLYEPFSTGPLTLTFNEPVYGIHVDFAIDVLNGLGTGNLQLITSSGSFSSPGLDVGGDFEGGTLIFSSSTPFTSATLQGFFPGGGSTQLAIDNLQLSTSTPEPSSAFLVAGILAAGLLSRLKRPRRR